MNYKTDISGPYLNRLPESGRLIFKDGLLIDPKNNIEQVCDIAILDDKVTEVGIVSVETNDRVIYAKGLYIMPGLIDMHLHQGDLFEITTNPIFSACEDGVTTAFSPGASNTTMAPALFSAETDRGLPINSGVYIGAAAILATMMSADDFISFFKGELSRETALLKLSRNPITVATGMNAIGIKEHMGHYILSDESLDKLFQITSKSNLLFMSHTQDIMHTTRLQRLSKGRNFYLGHATAALCGSHGGTEESADELFSLLGNSNIEAEFVSSMMRAGGGCREGMILSDSIRKRCFDKLSDKTVKILASDGQGQATMKGFGDSRDNIPAILEIAQEGVLPLIDAVATMTQNPAEYLYKITKCEDFKMIGNLSEGSYANITVVCPKSKRAIYTVVNGEIASFESRYIRRATTGRFISKFGIMKTLGVGSLPMYEVTK